MSEKNNTLLHQLNPLATVDATTVSIVERTEEPIGFMENAWEAAKGALKGALISGGLSAVVSGIIGALGGMNGSGAYLEQLDETGQIKLGGAKIPLVGVGPQVVLGEGVREALETQPAATGMALGAANSALNVGTSAALVGSAVGAIKGGWVDTIIRERTIKKQEIPTREC